MDTGSALSILPFHLVPKHITILPSNIKLSNADGSHIKVHGEATVEIDTGCYKKSLRRLFTINFVIAEITDIILGLDFLNKNNLMIDVNARTLVDKETGRQMSLETKRVQRLHLIVNNLEEFPQEVRKLFEQFPIITNVRDALFSPNTKSEHCIVTGSARPVFSRNRPLSPEKENFVKEELERLLHEGSHQTIRFSLGQCNSSRTKRRRKNIQALRRLSQTEYCVKYRQIPCAIHFCIHPPIAQEKGIFEDRSQAGLSFYKSQRI